MDLFKELIENGSYIEIGNSIAEYKMDKGSFSTKEKISNKHHLEYWVDYSTDKQVMGLIGCDMPKKYIAEMLCDRIAACKNYHGDRYTDADPYDYFMGNHKEQSIIHPKTREDLEMLLIMLRDKGEKETFRYVRKVYLKNK